MNSTAQLLSLQEYDPQPYNPMNQPEEEIRTALVDAVIRYADYLSTNIQGETESESALEGEIAIVKYYDGSAVVED